MCACKAGSVTIVDGLKVADSKEKCPLCREVNFAMSSIKAGRITFRIVSAFSPNIHCSSINIFISFTSSKYFHISIRTPLNAFGNYYIELINLPPLKILSSIAFILTHASHGKPVFIFRARLHLFSDFAIVLQCGVYEGAVHLEELNILLSRRYIYFLSSFISILNGPNCHRMRGSLRLFT